VETLVKKWIVEGNGDSGLGIEDRAESQELKAKE